MARGTHAARALDSNARRLFGRVASSLQATRVRVVLVLAVTARLKRKRKTLEDGGVRRVSSSETETRS
jgi:hypothetical protein